MAEWGFDTSDVDVLLPFKMNLSGPLTRVGHSEARAASRTRHGQNERPRKQLQ